jgi:hypothetical protein
MSLPRKSNPDSGLFSCPCVGSFFFKTESFLINLTNNISMSAKDFKEFTQHAKDGRTDLTANNRYWRTCVANNNGKHEMIFEFAGKLLHAKDHSGKPLYNLDGETPATFRLSGIGDGTTITWFFEKEGKEYTITEDLYGRFDETNKSVFSVLPKP